MEAVLHEIPFEKMMSMTNLFPFYIPSECIIGLIMAHNYDR